MLEKSWWIAFGDHNLNVVIDSALANNFDVLAAWQRLQAARALSRREAAELWPSFDASLQASKVYGEEAFRPDETIDLGIGASYEVDLWGRIRSQVQAEELRTLATWAEYRTATLSLAAELTLTWVQLAEAIEQIDLVDQQVETNNTVLQLIENRFGLGLVQSVDVLRQRQLVERTREQRIIADARRAALENRLAVLMGEVPGENDNLLPSELPQLPPLPDPGIPGDLIQRRPDVQQAFLRLQAADRDIASAVSNQFPRLSLSVSSVTTARGTQKLFQDWITTLSGDLLAPIFQGGELRAEVKRTRAVRQELLYTYGQTVLVALREVEDALVLEARQAEQIGLLEEQLQLADQAFVQLRVQYLNGASNYLDVLTALDDVQVLRRELLVARLALLEIRVALYRALAGPIDTPLEMHSE